MQESEAITLLLQRKPQGLAWLVEKYQTKAMRTAFLITQDIASAEDVVQDAFIKLYRNLRSFDSSRPFAPWFFKSVVNAAINSAHARRKYAWTVDDFETLADSALDPESVAEQNELVDTVKRAIEELSVGSRAVVVMRYYLEMNEAEIAEIAAAPVGTIKWRLHAARTKLRSMLAPLFGKEK